MTTRIFRGSGNGSDEEEGNGSVYPGLSESKTSGIFEDGWPRGDDDREARFQKVLGEVRGEISSGEDQVNSFGIRVVNDVENRINYAVMLPVNGSDNEIGEKKEEEEE